MAIGVLFEGPGVTQKMYESALKKLLKGKAGKKLADWPGKGLLSHAAGPTANGWRVVDAWQSEAAFKRFTKVLIPILKEEGFPEIAPQIFPLKRFIKE
jgi:hypothetical protein